MSGETLQFVGLGVVMSGLVLHLLTKGPNGINPRFGAWIIALALAGEVLMIIAIVRIDQPLAVKIVLGALGAATLLILLVTTWKLGPAPRDRDTTTP